MTWPPPWRDPCRHSSLSLSLPLLPLLLSLSSLSLSAAAPLKLALVDGNATVQTLCESAVSDAVNDGNCASQGVSILGVTACNASSPADGTVNAMTIYYSQGVDGFVAPTCVDEMAEISRLSFFLNKPTFVRVIASSSEIDEDLYPNTVQVASSSTQAIGLSIMMIAQQLGETEVTLVGPVAAFDQQALVADAVDMFLTENNLLTVAANIQVDESSLSSTDTTNIRSQRTKLVVVTDDFVNVATAMSALGMNSLVTAGQIVVIACTSPLQQCIVSASTFSSLGLLALAPEYNSTNLRIAVMQTILNSSYVADQFTSYRTAYDACYAFCWAAKKGASAGSNYDNYFTNASYTNRMGLTAFDAGYIIMQPYSVYSLSSATAFPTDLLDLTPTPKTCTAVACFILTATYTATSFWSAAANKTVDYSALDIYRQQDVWIVIVLVVILILVGSAIFAYYWYSRRRMMVYRLTWRVMKENLKIIETPKGKGKSTQDDRTNKRRANVAYALIGSIKAEFTMLRQIKRVRFSSEDLIFLMNLKRISHDNLATLIGISYNEVGFFYILHVLVERASLQAFDMIIDFWFEDFIEDVDFNLDNTFKSAFTRDIVRGLNYLHRTTIGYHGMLNTATCLIDANWVLKLSHFGFSTMLNHMIDDNVLEVQESLPMLMYYSTAPEMLKTCAYPRDYPKGNALADIYSLGTVIYSIQYERPPFEPFGNMKDQIDAIVNRNKKPDMSFAEDGPMKNILIRCFERRPEDRPSIREIHDMVTKMYSALQGNLIDQMIRMNEKYAMQLEKIVAQREGMLKEAQEQTDRLLVEMLPPSIAAQLKAKEIIVPRSYAAATVLFCQLVDFPVLLSKSNADQIIAFLNDVFSKFDDIIKQHDAYKVETTGETYMVASGVPNENEGRHVFEIADIALSLREHSYAYRVAYLSDFKVRVRIGFHCGPIAAGVIGIKAPRYCLFGDTVNFASRMQSNCPPDQIQTSEITAVLLMANDDYKLVKRGIVKVKGKGDVNCYWLNEHIHGEHGLVESHHEVIVGERPSTRSFRPRDPPDRPSLASAEPMVGQQGMLGPRSRSRRRSSKIEEEDENVEDGDEAASSARASGTRKASATNTEATASATSGIPVPKRNGVLAPLAPVTQKPKRVKIAVKDPKKTE